MIVKAPSKEFCLVMSKHCFNFKNEKGSWDWLFAWAMYEAYFPVKSVKR